MSLKGTPTDQEMVVLELLLDGKEWYGRQMIKAEPERLIEDSIYVVLTRMFARGFLTLREETAKERPRGRKRVFYKITAYGRQMYDVRLAMERAADMALAKGGVKKPAGAL